MTEQYLGCSDPSHEVNHGILIVGYGKINPNDQEDRAAAGECENYWVIRNSWGGSWGEEGFFKLCADNVGSDKTPLGTCLINKYAVWPTMNPNDIEN